MGVFRNSGLCFLAYFLFGLGAAAQTQQSCPSQGNGLICGFNGGDPDTLYSKRNEVGSVVRYCANGCRTMPARYGVRQDQCNGSLVRPSIIVQAGHENIASNCRDKLVGAHGAGNEEAWTPGIATCVVGKLSDAGYDARHVDANFNCDPDATKHYDAVVAIHYRDHYIMDVPNPLAGGYFVDTLDQKFDAATDDSHRLVDKISDAYGGISGVDRAVCCTNRSEINQFYMKNNDLIDDPSKCGFELSQDTPFALIESGVGDPEGQDYNTLWLRQDKVCEGIVKGILDYLVDKFGPAPNVGDGNVLLHPPHPEPPRMMLVGDSITHGKTGDFTWRYRLYEHLRNKGASVDFVGPFKGPYNPYNKDNVRDQGIYKVEGWDDQHDATWGRYLVEEKDAIEGFVRTYAPDIVIVDLGTNDLTWGWVKHLDAVGNANRVVGYMNEFIRNARRAKPNLHFILAAIGQAGPLEERAEPAPYNKALVTLMRDLDTPQSRISIANVFGHFNRVTDTYDQTHPNWRGEHVIAQAVADTLWNTYQYGGTYAPIPLSDTSPPPPQHVVIQPAVIDRSTPFTVIWDRVVNPGVWTEYKVQVRLHQAFGFGLVWEAPGTTANLALTYNGPPLPLTGIYHVVVLAVDTAGQQTLSDPAPLVVNDVSPPPANPANVRLAPSVIGRDGGFVANWDRVVNPGIWTEYRVEVHTHHAFGGALVWKSFTTTPNLSLTYDGPRFPQSGVYEVFVIARDWVGQEAVSAPALLTVNELVPPPLPPQSIRLAPTAVDRGAGFSVTWDRVPNPKVWTEYKVRMRTHPNFGYAFVSESPGTTPDLSAVYSAPTTAGIYSVLVVARDINGQETESAPALLTVQQGPAPPQAPVNVRVFPNTINRDGVFTAAWDRVVNPGIWTTYKIQVHDHYNFGFAQLWESAWTPNLSLPYLGPTFPRNGVYNLVVVAHDTFGQENTSEPIPFTVMDTPVPPLAPANVILFPNAIRRADPLTVVWNRVVNPDIWTEYKVQIRNHPAYGGAIVWQTPTTSPDVLSSIPGSSLAQAGIYQVVIVARDIFGQETVSVPVTLTVNP